MNKWHTYRNAHLFNSHILTYVFKYGGAEFLVAKTEVRRTISSIKSKRHENPPLGSEDFSEVLFRDAIVLGISSSRRPRQHPQVFTHARERTRHRSKRKHRRPQGDKQKDKEAGR